jgi:hypothetical protein
MTDPRDNVAKKLQLGGPMREIRTLPSSTTLGDLLDIALGGPVEYVCHNCNQDSHSVCLGYYGGRNCTCTTGDHPLRRK